jgi:hypothetical protein
MVSFENFDSKPKENLNNPKRENYYGRYSCTVVFPQRISTDCLVVLCTTSY